VSAYCLILIFLRSSKIESDGNNPIAPTPPSRPAPPEPDLPKRARVWVVEEETPEFVPHLLTQLEDELARSRMREAFWISVIVHIVFVLLVIFSPQLFPNFAPVHLLSAQDLARTKEPTYLELPQDLQKPPEKVHTDKLSDKNRIAQTTRPIDKKTLEALREARGNRMPPGPQAASPQTPQAPGGAPQQQPPSNSQSAMNNQPQQRVQPQEQPRENPFKMPGSAGAAIAQAARNAPRMGSSGGGGGAGYGTGPSDRNANMGPFDILSDTQGVDFGPYLSRVLQSIKNNWYTLIPEEARAPLLKHGKVAIRFLITPNGKVAGMFIEAPSGDVPLDRAAYGGITASDPFSPLPHEFHGPYLALRITFFYNPKTGELEQ
jgi:TonB family protein